MATNNQNDNTGGRSRVWSLFRNVLLLGAGILVFSNLSALVGVGLLAYSSARIFMASRSGLRAMSGGLFRRGRRGWESRRMPLGMRESTRLSRGRSLFRAAGIDDLVRGESGIRGTEFSFEIGDESAAYSLRDALNREGVRGVDMFSIPGGRAMVSSGDAELICRAAELAFPPRVLSLRRTVETVSQYLVTGCSGREEAEEMCRAGRGTKVCDYVNVIDEADGVCVARTDGASFSGTLEQGSYIVNMTSRNVYADRVTVPHMLGADGRERPVSDYIGSAFSRFEEGDGTRQAAECTVVPEVSCSADVSAGRFIQRGGSRTRVLSKDSPDVVRPDLCAVYRFQDFTSFLDSVMDDRPFQGGMALIRSLGDVLVPREDDFVLTIPAGAELLGSLRMSERMVDRVMGDYGGTGITREDVHLSSVIDEIDQNGYVSAVMSESPDLSGARVNGVPLTDVLDRFVDSEGRMASVMPEGGAAAWVRDAGMISGVEMHADWESMEMVVRTTVDLPDGRKIVENRRKVDGREMDAVLSRQYTMSELKDFSMQLNPDIFASYRLTDESGAVRGLFENPMKSFIGNEAPARAAVPDRPAVIQEPAAAPARKRRKKGSSIGN